MERELEPSGISRDTWEGPERRSDRSRLARSVVEAKTQVQGYKDEIRRTPRRRFRRRSELEQSMDAARERERNLLAALGAKPFDGPDD